MPWRVSVSKDADKADVGSVTATFYTSVTDPLSGKVTNTDVFTYSVRIQANVVGGASFVKAAKDALAAFQAGKTTEATIAQRLEQALNA